MNLNSIHSLTQLPVELLEQLFDAMGDVVFCVKDVQGSYRSTNIAFVERIGARDKSELVGKKAGDLFSPSLARIFEEQDQRVFENLHPLQGQLERISQSDGTVGWFLASKFPIFEADGSVAGLVGISQNLNWPRESDLELDNLSLLVEYINGHLDHPLRTEQLAKRIEMSTIQLDRRMKRVFRLSTKKFIMKCRLEKATRLLESTDLALSSIALSCGFTDQSSFTRHFRAATSDTPASFRKRVR